MKPSHQGPMAQVVYTKSFVIINEKGLNMMFGTILKTSMIFEYLNVCSIFSAPIMPPQSLLLGQVNSTEVLLNLNTWLSGGCPITAFEIRYKIWGDDKWETVDSYISGVRVSLQNCE